MILAIRSGAVTFMLRPVAAKLFLAEDVALEAAGSPHADHHLSPPTTARLSSLSFLESINMVADALIYHPTVAHYPRYVATTGMPNVFALTYHLRILTRTPVGRDKLLRTLQYFSRFYAWYLFRTNNPASAIAPFEAIKKQFGLSRKLMRVGKNVEHFKAAAQTADDKSADPVLKYLGIGRQLGYAFYLTMDSITYLDAAGIRPSAGAKRLQKEAYKAWFAGLLCNALAGVYTLYKLREQEKGIDKKDGEAVVEGKKIEKYVTFLSHLSACKTTVSFDTLD